MITLILKKTKSLFFFALIGFNCLSCGRYAPPVPPEFTAPPAVVDLDVKPSESAINFSWKAPEKDVRGEPLKNLVGYKIYRAELELGEKLIPNKLKLKEISEVPDKYLKKIIYKREEAKASGTPIRKAKVDESDKNHFFTDSQLKNEQIYVYKIVAFNNIIESQNYDLVRIKFNGLKSVIDLNSAKKIATPEFVDTEEDLLEDAQSS